MSKLDLDFDAMVGVDSETCRIRRGLPAPPVVCTGFYYPERSKPDLYGTADQWRALLELLASDRLIIGHNIAYDMCCWMEWCPKRWNAELRRLVFAAYDADRVVDTMLVQRLIEIETGDSRGRLSLDRLCHVNGLECPKDLVDSNGIEVRTGYGKYLNVPLDQWEAIYREYAAGDPEMTWRLATKLLSRGLVSRAAAGHMARADLGLKLTSAFGLTTDEVRVAALEESARQNLSALQGLMIDEGFMRWERGKPQPVKTLSAIKRAVAEAWGLPVDEKGKFVGSEEAIDALKNQGLLTKTGGISTSRQVLADSGDELLIRLADYGEWSAVWNKDLRIFRYAWELPFHTRFGFAATTRTTSGGPNIQNFRKKAGIRECITSQFGALVSTDYTGLENATLAQTIYWTLGLRTMADKISAGWDFHSEVGAHIMGISYEQMRTLIAAADREAKKCRAAAKPLNFGLVGFMTKASTVRSYAKIGYGVDLPVERWQELIDLWYATQHDQVAYLTQYVESLKTFDGIGALYNAPIPGTDIIRRGASRTAAANTGFQGPGAVVAESGLYLINKDQLLGQMPGRACAFIHDEVITDCANDDIEQVRYCQERLMLEAAEQHLPDVQMSVDSCAMPVWSKNAEAKFDSSGNMVADMSVLTA